MSWSRHLAALKDAWISESRRRRENAAWTVETEFLPAALEVTETPPSPIGRAILWMIVGSALAALAWAFWAKIDTVAVAEGRLVPTGRLRNVEAPYAGIVREIAVEEGEHVRAGQKLIALDPTMADADAQSARTEWTTASLALARANALLRFAATGQSAFQPPPQAQASAIEAERQLIGARIQSYQARRAALEQRRAGAEASVRTARAEITKLERLLPIARGLLDSQRALEAKGFGARQRTLQQEQAVIVAEQDLQAQRGRLEESLAQGDAIGRDIDDLRQQFVAQAAQERTEAEGLAATRQDALGKAHRTRALQDLVAPVDGVVQAIAVTTLGEVVEPGKPLATVVPDGERLVVEALMLNRDFGFVRLGDRAVVKLDAYNFTRYGTITGKVVQISPDAIVDERRGLVFPVKVALAAGDISVDGRRNRLSSGMSGTVEIITGQRRVIDFLISPIRKSVQEAGRER